MRLSPRRPLDLTYCTNIHPAHGWPAVRRALERHAPALKARFSPEAPFGVGLRLSAEDARGLQDGHHVDEFRNFLDGHGLYVAIINGFPHGSFHGSVVKADVYAPDWRSPERVRYTLELAGILSRLLPEGMDGGVSTVPLSYKAWVAGDASADWHRMIGHLVDVAAALVRLRQERGVFIHVDIEPEPDCLLETTAETLAFFHQRLLPEGAPLLSTALGIGPDEARQHLLDHLQLCFDCCHFSVEHEDPATALEALVQSGIRIGRIQLSSALHVTMPRETVAQQALVGRLHAFADAIYLHQVIRRQDDRSLEHLADLGEALARPAAGDWRVHFHVPLFTRSYEGLDSTQDDVQRVLALVAASSLTSHLEIETYTWDVLPSHLKIDLSESIAREYAWVLAHIGSDRGA